MPDEYTRRVVDDELDALMPHLGALAIEGAKGVGKTETASRRAATVYDLDDPTVIAIAIADPPRLLRAAPPILLDEWQRLPETWDLVRRAVDRGAPPGSFLLTGSASTTSPQTHSGAGRIVAVRMRPFSLAERGLERPTVSLAALLEGGLGPLEGSTGVTLDGYVDAILASGFPGLRGLTDRALRAQLDGYLSRIVEHDFEQMGRPVRNPSALRRWLAAYAAASSTTTSYEKIRDAATGGEGEKPAKSTTAPYRDILERLWIVDPVPAWLPSRNPISRLTAAPKHQLVDPALAARLLGIGSPSALTNPSSTQHRDANLLGVLFESLLTLSVRVYAQTAEASVSHLRMAAGEREVDLVVERGDGRVVAIEVKLARNVGDADVRHLLWLRERIGDELLDAVVVCTGTEAYRRRDGIAVVPAALLGP